MSRIAPLVVIAAIISSAPDARAHGMRSGYLELTEVSAGVVLARFTLSAEAAGVGPRLPATCHVASTIGSMWRLECSGPLAGAEVGVDGLGPNISEAVVFITLADGSVQSHLLTPAAPTWQIPRAASAGSTLRQYVSLGVRHIALGVDHLLFLLLLVLTLERPKSVLLAESAFTFSHSLSFSATALGLVRVSSEAAEACIALSLLLVAVDVGRSERTLGDRAAAGMALVFGLVHGLGFATGLREIGLPEQHVAFSLLGFALGVEVGQVAFLIFALLALHAISRTRARQPIVRLATVASGSLASLWLIERVLVIVRS